MSKFIGGRIKEFRLERGLTLQAVADELGLTPAAISHWESGRIIPKDRKLQDLARVLKTSVADLKGIGPSAGQLTKPMAEISDILWDAKKRIADRMGCEPQDVELVLSFKTDRSGR